MELVYLSGRETAVPPNYTDVLREVCRDAGMDHAAYGAIIPDQDAVHTYSTYPDSWVQVHRERLYYKTHPAIVAARGRLTPVDWSTLRDDPLFQEICEEGLKHGVPCNGVTMSVRGPHGDLGLLALSKHCTEAEWARLLPARIGQFMLYATQLHDSVISHVFGEDLSVPNDPPRLARREIRILSAIDRGDSSEEIARKLRIAPRTIETNLKAARLKLRAVTTAHALMRARAFGLIEKD